MKNKLSFILDTLNDARGRSWAVSKTLDRKIIYLDARFNPVSKDKAVLIKIIEGNKITFAVIKGLAR